MARHGIAIEAGRGVVQTTVKKMPAAPGLASRSPPAKPDARLLIGYLVDCARLIRFKPACRSFSTSIADFAVMTVAEAPTAAKA
jgi:hypothetical protein